MGLLWALINDMSYGHEGVEAQDRLYTNGRFDVTLVFEVFFSLVGLCAVCVLLFWWFRFLHRDHNDAS